MVLDLPRTRIGQPRDAADRHAHGQVVPFRIAGRDMGRTGPAFDRALADPDADRRAAPLLGIQRSAIQFEELRKIHIAAERTLDRSRMRRFPPSGSLASREGPD